MKRMTIVALSVVGMLLGCESNNEVSPDVAGDESAAQAGTAEGAEGEQAAEGEGEANVDAAADNAGGEEGESAAEAAAEADAAVVAAQAAALEACADVVAAAKTGKPVKLLAVSKKDSKAGVKGPKQMRMTVRRLGTATCAAEATVDGEKAIVKMKLPVAEVEGIFVKEGDVWKFDLPAFAAVAPAKPSK